METNTEKNCEGAHSCKITHPDKTGSPLNKTFSEDSCPDCGSRDLRFGSRDVCEGDYYVCKDCGLRIKYPLNYCRKFIAPVLDADTLQAAIAGTPFPDSEPFDPERCVRDLVGS